MAAPVRSFLALAGALSALLLVAAPALAANGGFSPVEPESPQAEEITDTFWFISIFIVGIFVLVEGVLIAFVLRYRRRGRPRDTDGPQVHGSTRLELMWTLAPVLILAAIATFVFVKLPGIQDAPSVAKADASLQVRVIGRQFYWQFEYPNGVIAINRLVAPQGRSVRLTVTAPDFDVIHSWWIPALNGKMDAIPGVENHLWFTAGRAGIFHGQCAELCGLKHAKMLGEVEVLPAADFDRWLDQRRAGQSAGTSELGEDMWTGVCAVCHGLEGQGGYGPPIAGSSILTDPAAVERLLRNGLARPGRGVMPPVGKDWGPEQMDAMTDYLEERFGGGQS
jgi:cytochrome c oxidase subunit II